MKLINFSKINFCLRMEARGLGPTEDDEDENVDLMFEPRDSLVQDHYPPGTNPYPRFRLHFGYHRTDQDHYYADLDECLQAYFDLTPQPYLWLHTLVQLTPIDHWRAFEPEILGAPSDKDPQKLQYQTDLESYYQHILLLTQHADCPCRYHDFERVVGARRESFQETFHEMLHCINNVQLCCECCDGVEISIIRELMLSRIKAGILPPFIDKTKPASLSDLTVMTIQKAIGLKLSYKAVQKLGLPNRLARKVRGFIQNHPAI